MQPFDCLHHDIVLFPFYLFYSCFRTSPKPYFNKTNYSVIQLIEKQEKQTLLLLLRNEKAVL